MGWNVSHFFEYVAQPDKEIVEINNEINTVKGENQFVDFIFVCVLCHEEIGLFFPEIDVNIGDKRLSDPRPLFESLSRTSGVMCLHDAGNTL